VKGREQQRLVGSGDARGGVPEGASEGDGILGDGGNGWVAVTDATEGGRETSDETGEGMEVGVVLRDEF
jgi:hypothetical protein